MRIGIVGGGMMGVSLGYFLSQQGAEVEIFEAAPRLGGLAGRVTLTDGTEVDRFYHTILSSDTQVRGLCEELDLSDQLRFAETGMGFYYQHAIHPMNNVIDFMRFPPLGWVDRFRLGLTVLWAQFVRDWEQLENVNVEEWLTHWSGRRTYEDIWRPLLKAKFDGSFEDTPATYIWSRLVRMKSTRSGASQKEEAGYFAGGYLALIEAMGERIGSASGQVHLGSPVEEIVIEGNRAQGVRTGGELRGFDAVVATVQLPIFRQLIPDADQEYLAYLDKTEYLGIVCPLLVLDRPLTGCWTLNITDDRVPFTGIIETTTYIDPADVGGHHLIYLPKYTTSSSRWQSMSDEEIQEVWLQNLEVMFPAFDRGWIYQFVVNRESYVEPLHGLNGLHLIPQARTPIDKLHLMTTAQIYPELTNSESVSRYACDMANTIVQTDAA